MQVTQESLKKYIGGQLEFQNVVKHEVHRGEIETIDLTDSEVKVGLTWCAEMKIGQGWIKSEKLDWSGDMASGRFSEIGQSRLSFFTAEINEMTVFFPLGGSRLDPRRVEGLELPK